MIIDNEIANLLTDSQKIAIIKATLSTPDGRVEYLRKVRDNPQLAEQELSMNISDGIFDGISADWIRAFIRLVSETPVTSSPSAAQGEKK